MQSSFKRGRFSRVLVPLVVVVVIDDDDVACLTIEEAVADEREDQPIRTWAQLRCKKATLFSKIVGFWPMLVDSDKGGAVTGSAWK